MSNSDFTQHDVNDPLAGLVERATDDPGAPFKPDVLIALAELRAEDRAAFEALRATLKAAKIRVTALDAEIDRAAGIEPGERQTQCDTLLALAGEAELFHTADQTAFADVRIGDHRETLLVRGRGFRRWLSRAFFLQEGGAPNGEAMGAALGVIEAKAFYDGPERAVFIRTGEHDGKLYIDVADETWRAIEIDATGWRIIAEPPCRFRRAAGMLPLPVPVAGGSLAPLRALLNVGSEADFILATAWMLAALRPSGPFPLLALTGEQGSAKTTFARILRSLIDPNSAGQRSLPREDRDLFIAATNGHILSFDNVSGLPSWISDTLCRLATGGGFATRTLYSDSDETILDAMRPILLNGIGDIISRPDLAERAIFLILQAIAETERRAEAAINAAIDAARPEILGALLDAMSRGLHRLPETRLDRMPRMADFALWATACGDGHLWPEGGFMSAFDANRAKAIDDAIEGDPVANAIRTLMTNERAEGRTDWTGTAGELLTAVARVAGETATRSKTWPADLTRFSSRLTRVATVLRAIGIEIGRYRASHGVRMVHLFFQPAKGRKTASPASPASQTAENGHFSGDAKGDATGDASAPGDATGDAGDASRFPSVTRNPLKTKPGDAGDAGDAKFPTLSGSEKTHMPNGVGGVI
ncbi:hypothetical protein [Acidiphilium sp.]|uniref:hypothetical protein n=1 Tax=Acidiphilium sp. TaxID=527 RepID=UPI00258B143D|nr:hypothetical protein [Acidiphilium sp.]